jgi:cellulose synthase operon protein C
VHPASRPARRSLLTLGVLAAVLGSLPAPRASAEAPSPLDPKILEAAARAREVKGVGGYAALRELWRRWDQGDPAQIEEAIASVARDASVAPPVRAYAGMLAAYARRRRGDLEGSKRRIKALGFVDHWLIAGPFDNEAKASLNTPFGPEEDLRSPVAPGKTYEGKERPVAWRSLPDVSSYGWLDLGNAVRPSEKVCAYATTFVRTRPTASARDAKADAGAGAKTDAKAEAKAPERRASIWVGASGAFKVFWNGEEVLADSEYRSLDADRFAAPITVKPGWNRLTVKVCGDEEGPMLQARLASPEGAADPALEVRADAAVSEEAASNSQRPASRPGAAARARKALEGRGRIEVVAKGDPYAKGAGAETGGAVKAAPTAGALAGLPKLLAEKSPSADELEAYARYLAMTGGEPKGQHQARDLASRAADTKPTVSRMLLAAELAEDRNIRASWIKRAREAVSKPDEDLDVTVAEALLARGGFNFRDATPFFDKLLARDPSSIAGLLGRAELYEEAGMRHSALVTLEGAVRRAPQSVALLRAYAHALRAVGRAAEAEDAERRYANLRFDDVTYLRAQADLAVNKRDVAASTRWLERLSELDPESLATLEFAARGFRALGNPERARATLERRLAICPDDVEGLRALADMVGESGNKEEQLKLLRRILVLRPQAKDIREYVEHAQPPKIRRDEAFAWDKDQLLALAKQPPSTAGYPRRTLRDLRVTTVYANGLSSHFNQVVFQPMTDEGAAAARQYAFSYQSGREVVDVRAARVYRTNGQVDETIETGEGRADDPSLAMYTSTRAFYVQLPKLTPGDVVELRYRVEEVTPRNEYGDSFSETAYVQQLEPTASTEYVLLTPKARKVNVRFPQQPGFAHEESDDGDLHIVRVTGRDIPPLTPEPAMPPLPELLAAVNASTFSTWDEVGRWYWGLSKDQFDADDEVRKRVKEITQGLTTDLEKVRAVYGYVVQRTRYVALEFGIEGFRPRRCAQTLARGWGDCKDKATVIVTMLRELGIPANIVLVRTQLRGDTPTEPPAYALFDHAIAYVPKLDIFLDGTAEYTGMNELPAFDRGALGLIVSDTGAKLVHLPEPVADQTVRSRRIEMTVPDSGPAAVDVKLEATGAVAADWRQRFHAAATQRARILDDLGGELGGMTLTPGPGGLEVSDLESIEQPVKLHLRGKALGVTRTGGDLSFSPAPATSLVGRYASLSSRRQDVKLPFAYGFDDEWSIKLPSGATVKHSPEDRELASPFGKLELKVEKAQGKLVVRSKLRLEKTRVTPAQYPAFRAFCQDVDRALGERVVIGK